MDANECITALREILDSYETDGYDHHGQISDEVKIAAIKRIIGG